MTAPVPSLWPRDRAVVALAAGGTGLLTALVAELAWGAEGWVRLPAVALVVVAVVAAVRPLAVTAVPVTGAVVAAAALIEPAGRAWWLVAVLAGTVATTELAALAGRLAVVLPKPAGPGLVEVGRLTALAAAAVAVALAAARLSGSAGALAVVLAGLAAVALAAVLLRPDRT